MCFSSKPKVPKVQAAAIVPPPAPLLETPTEVKFGGTDEDYERKEETKVDKDTKVTRDSRKDDDDNSNIFGSDVTGLAESRKRKTIRSAIKSKGGK